VVLPGYGSLRTCGLASPSRNFGLHRMFLPIALSFRPQPLWIWHQLPFEAVPNLWTAKEKAGAYSSSTETPSNYVHRLVLTVEARTTPA